MSIHDLQVEHIGYLMQGFKNIGAAIKNDSDFKIDSKMAKMIVEFTPRLLKHNEGELYRYMIGDALSLIEGHAELWEVDILSSKELSTVHRQCEIFLDGYLDKSKRNMNGV